MIENDVENQFHIAGMHFFQQGLKGDVFGLVTRVDFGKIESMVAVIIVTGGVFHHRGDPDRSESQRFDVIEFFDESLEVSAPCRIGRGILAVPAIDVVGRIAVVKAGGDRKVDRFVAEIGSLAPIRVKNGEIIFAQFIPDREIFIRIGDDRIDRRLSSLTASGSEKLASVDIGMTPFSLIVPMITDAADAQIGGLTASVVFIEDQIDRSQSFREIVAKPGIVVFFQSRSRPFSHIFDRAVIRTVPRVDVRVSFDQYFDVGNDGKNLTGRTA